VDDQEYKRLCAQPDVMKRSEIRATLTRLRRDHGPLAASLERIMSLRALAKPVNFQGSSENDYFYLDLSEDELEDIADALADLERALAMSGTDASELAFVASLHDKWRDAESSRPAT
jgi:hypothetical protein